MGPTGREGSDEVGASDRVLNPFKPCFLSVNSPSALPMGPKGGEGADVKSVQVIEFSSDATNAQAQDPGDDRERLLVVLGNCVRNRRLRLGLNVRQLAQRTGLSTGMVSRIENARRPSSLATIEALAAALDVPVTTLFGGLAEERDAVFVKAGTGPEIVRKETRTGHQYELLGTLRGPSRLLEPVLVTLREAGEVLPVFQHSGIEILFMLEGVMKYSHGRGQYLMEVGDTLQFEGDVPHGPASLMRMPVRFLSFTIYD
jgi:transcriptional regulator with XRE-family HTH domain